MATRPLHELLDLDSIDDVEAATPVPTRPLVVVAALAEDECARSTFQFATAITAPGAAKALFVIEVPTTVADWMLTAAEIEESLGDPRVRDREALRIRQAMGIDTAATMTIPLALAVGQASQCILAHARANDADLVVVGLRHHSATGRLLGTDTAGQVLAANMFAVLAVQPTLTGRPQRVVVGVDFTRASLRAAALARQIVAPGGRVRLVHVRREQGEPRLERDRAEQLVAARGADALLEALTRTLRASTDAEVVSAVITGDPIDALLMACEQCDADLLAVGTQHYRLRDRVRLGSVASALRRRTPCSLLLAPAPVVVTAT
jgi:nucleotide-binding universal stress UspA family protein